MESYLIETTLEEMKDDFDWHNAFCQAETSCCNSHSDLLMQVEEVIASANGENDGDYWIALVKLTDGRFCKMSAGCDYTGWDCCACGILEFYTTREELLSKNTLTADEANRLRIPWV